MRNRLTRRIVSLLLTASMLIGMLPTAFAADNAADSFTNPFTSGTLESTSWRIPALVTLSDGTLVAAADARWNTTYDGGGLDTAVAYSTDNGATWSTSLVNYFGDNGNEYNASSTCFIDPALATNGSTVWMLCDLYPYGIALNGNGSQTAPSTGTGFDSDGKLLLTDSSTRSSSTPSYKYYLDGKTIYSSDGTAVEGLSVDAEFNITGTYNGSNVNSNLFYENSPFKVYPTGYMYLKTSTDGGKSWSDPTLLNLKTSSEQVCLVGPGRGIVTSDSSVIFPVYSYNGSTASQALSFISMDSETGSWTRSDSLSFTNLNSTWSSEAAVVELSSGALRFFFRNDNSAICYADYGNGWSSPVNTGIASNSDTQLSAISYSKTIDGKQVILLSCPTGPNGNGSNDNDGSYRTSGKLHVFTVEADNAMKLQKKIDITNVATGQLSGCNYTAENGFFAYSCLTEMADGSVALLYENNQYGWGAGESNYYTITSGVYSESDLGVTDSTTSEGDADTEIGNSTMPDTNVTITDTKTVSIPVGGTAEYTDNTGNYAASGNTIYNTAIATMTMSGTDAFSSAKVLSDNSSVDLSECLYTFTTSGDYYVIESSFYDGIYLNNVDSSGPQIPNCTTPGQVSVSAETFTIDNSTAYMFKLVFQKTATSTYDGTPTLHFHTEMSSPYWDRCGTDDSYKCREFLYRPAATDAESSSEIPGYVQVTSESEIVDGGQYLIVQKNTEGNYYVLHPSTSTTNSAHVAKVTGEFTTASTDITFTGMSVGETYAIVGTTKYNITVTPEEKSFSIIPGGTITTPVTGSVTPEQIAAVNASGLVTVTSDDTTLTFTANSAEGTTKAYLLGNTIYTINVANRGGYQGEITVKVNNTQLLSVGELKDGETVSWSVLDDGIASVGTMVDGSTESANAFVLGKTAGSSTTVTAIVTDITGNEVEFTWKVNVIAHPDNKAGEGTRYVYMSIEKMEHCTVYFSVNGGELHKVTAPGVIIDRTIYAPELSNIMFFAAPEEGYALTYIGAEVETNGTKLDKHFFSLAGGTAEDGSDTHAWPFDDANQIAIPEQTSSKWAEADTTDGVTENDHGVKWPLLQGNFTIEELRTMYTKALEYGCTGMTQITTNDTQNGSSKEAKFTFIAQKLAVVDKEIWDVFYYVLDDAGNQTSTIKNRNPVDGEWGIKLNDYITFQITLTIPGKYTDNTGEDYGTITYNNMQLSDTMMGLNFITGLGGTITYRGSDFVVDGNTLLKKDTIIDTSESLFTTLDQQNTDIELIFEATVQLTPTNYGLLFTNNSENDESTKISNTASLAYSYFSTYATNSLDDSDDEVISAYLWYDTFVLDFGLPTTIDLSLTPYLHNDMYRLTSLSTNGSAEIGWTEGENYFTYTLTKPMTQYHLVTYTVQGTEDGETVEHTYHAFIVPASNMLYEEGFMAIEDKDTRADWSNGQSTVNVAGIQQGGGNMAPYGYDIAYANETEVSGGTYATSVTSDQYMSDALVFEIKNTTALDIIGNAGPSTANLYVTLRPISGSGRNIIRVVDTTYDHGTLYQVPLAHIEGLDPTVTYKVSVYAGYNAANLASLMGSSNVPNGQVYQILREIGLTESDIANAEYVGFDEERVSLFDGGNTTTGQTLTIDGFRLYRSTKNAAYFSAMDKDGNIYNREYDAIYTNVTDAAAGEVYAYIESTDSSGKYNIAIYESEKGGPQDEIYIPPNYAVVFKLSSAAYVDPTDASKTIPVSAIQVSARAVSAPTGLNNTAITSNTEMYYEVTTTETEDGSVIATILNTGSGLLAIGNLKSMVDFTEIGYIEPSSATDEAIILSLRNIYGTEDSSELEANITNSNQVTVEVNTHKVDCANAMAIITVMSDNGQMLKSAMRDLSTLRGSDDFISIRETVSSIPTDGYVRVMVVDKTTYKPLCGVVTASKSMQRTNNQIP